MTPTNEDLLEGKTWEWEERVRADLEATWRDVFLKAASTLEEEGRWCQGAMFDLRGSLGPHAGTKGLSIIGYVMEHKVPVCAMGATMTAMWEMGVHDDGELTYRSSWLNGKAHKVGGHSLMGFNDTKGQTAHAVAEYMRRLATT